MTASAEKARILALFGLAWPRHAAKRAARAAGVPIGTAKAWVAGRFLPSAEALLRMAAEDDRLADELERTLHDLRAARADRSAAAARAASALAGPVEVTR